MLQVLRFWLAVQPGLKEIMRPKPGYISRLAYLTKTNPERNIQNAGENLQACKRVDTAMGPGTPRAAHLAKDG